MEVKLNDSMTPPRIQLIYTFDKSLYFPVLRPREHSNTFNAPALWMADQPHNQLSHSRAIKIG